MRRSWWFRPHYSKTRPRSAKAEKYTVMAATSFARQASIRWTRALNCDLSSPKSPSAQLAFVVQVSGRLLLAWVANSEFGLAKI